METSSDESFTWKKVSEKSEDSSSASCPNSSDESNLKVKQEGSVKNKSRIKKEINSSDAWESENSFEEKKIKKKKSKGDSSLKTESTIHSAEQVLPESPTIKNKKRKRFIDSESDNTLNNAVSQQSVSHDIEHLENGTNIESVLKIKQNKKDKTKKSKTKQLTNGIDEEYEDIDNLTLNDSRTIQQNNHSTSILDRIQFEDDLDSVSDVHHKSPKNLKEPYSSKIKTFLSANSSLKPIPTAENNISEITENDEIWILKCPSEVDVINFSDKDLSMDSKSKIKLNGETYYGILDNESSNIVIISNGDDKYKMHNVKINGSIRLKKRLPKPRFAEEINTKMALIPLPETKCRHPLFGSDYKRAIKIPTSIRQRLVIDTETPKRKKQKREIKSEDEVMIIKKPKFEAANETPVKKNKKRKHSHDEGIVKKTKRMKKEMNSSEVWESEKAIEENLFNF